MARLPFKPPTPPAGGDRPLTVSQLAERIGAALEKQFPGPVRVVGEITGFNPGTHWYFSLKDAQAVVPCVMFTGQARRAGFTPSNGTEVVCTGRPDFYAKGGRTSFVVERIEPVGAGALDLAFRALCDELRRLGWFESARKRPIPQFPRRIGLVTSKTGAAIQDVLVTMRRRCPAVEIALVDVRVQGDGAAAEIARAIAWLGSEHTRLGIDAILVTRGGGSKEDLWSFNERIVAEAIVNSPVPVVAAIGHESDVTVAELVADERCATPTQAAVRLSPDTSALLEQFAVMEGRLRTGLRRVVRERAQALAGGARHLATTAGAALRAHAHRLEVVAGRLERHRPAAVHARRRAQLEAAHTRLFAALRQRLARIDLPALEGNLSRAWAVARNRLSARVHSVDRQLAVVGPIGVLERGFSATIREDGTLVRSIEQVAPGARVRTRVRDGVFRSVVDGPGAPGPLRRQRPARPGDPGQMDLFAPGR